MRRIDPQDTYAPVEPSISGPLFDGGPYDSSPIGQPSSDAEEIVARLIWQHRGCENPISIERIRLNSDLSAREVKAIVWDLRVSHQMPIGARRKAPVGYYWIVDSDDRDLALAPYRGQILTMWQTLRKLDTPSKLRELRDKMTVEEPE